MKRVERVVWVFVDVAADAGLWFLATAALVIFGFSVYSVISGPFLAPAVVIVVAILLTRRFRKRNAELFTERLAPFLAGKLATTLRLEGIMLVAHPHAILPG